MPATLPTVSDLTYTTLQQLDADRQRNSEGFGGLLNAGFYARGVTGRRGHDEDGNYPGDLGPLTGGGLLYYGEAPHGRGSGDTVEGVERENPCLSAKLINLKGSRRVDSHSNDGVTVQRRCRCKAMLGRDLAVLVSVVTRHSV